MLPAGCAAGLGQLPIGLMGADVILCHPFGPLAPGEQVRAVQRHIEDGVRCLVGLGSDVPGRLHILPAQVQTVVAVVNDGGALPRGVDGGEL